MVREFSEKAIVLIVTLIWTHLHIFVDNVAKVLWKLDMDFQ